MRLRAGVRALLGAVAAGLMAANAVGAAGVVAPAAAGRAPAPLAAVAAAPAPGHGPPPAQARSLEMQGFGSTVTVTPSGRVHVTERITFRFNGSWNGIYRTIPIRYETPRGFDYRLRVELESVTLADGTELRVETDREGDDLAIRAWVPGARDVTRTLVFSYRVENGLRFFENHDELYWNATGLEWDIPVGDATARVILPEGVTGVRATAYTGAYGSRDGEVAIENDGATLSFSTTEPLEFREGLTVVVGWDPGLVERPSALEQAGGFLGANILLLLPLVSLVGMWTHWRRRGRDPELGSIAPVYRPPEGLSPGEAGTLVDNRPDMRDIGATIVDLAVRGYLRIEEEEEKGLKKLFGGDVFRFVLLRGPDRWGELLVHERRILQGIFSGEERAPP